MISKDKAVLARQVGKAAQTSDRQCPESAYINIIPSRLCNKSLRVSLS